MVRGHTDHNVNSAIALERKIEEGKLVVPVDDIALDRRGFSSGRAKNSSATDISQFDDLRSLTRHS